MQYNGKCEQNTWFSSTFIQITVPVRDWRTQSALQPLESVNTPEKKESSGLGTKRGYRLCTSFVVFRGATMGPRDVHFVLCTLKKWTVHLKYFRYLPVVTKPSCHTHHQRCANSLKIDSEFYIIDSDWWLKSGVQFRICEIWTMFNVGVEIQIFEHQFLGSDLWNTINWWFDLDSNL